MNSKEHINLTESYSAHNYSPVPVVIARGEGCWVWDVEGVKYFDMMAAYSAMNFGHSNPRFKKKAIEQLDRITIISRAFMNDQMGPFCKELAELCGMEVVLPMNSGAEAVETALKCVRRWGYQVKGIPSNKAEIICMTNNFAGRTISIVSFSTEEDYKKNFGPLTAGFVIAPYGDFSALEKLVNKNTAGILLEPIQGEGGIIIPPDGYLKKVRDLCTAQNILMVADEIQTGLCRTGEVFACDHEGVKPDLMVLGKSLGAGITPISALIGSHAVMDVFNPGSHGSTFGGNSFACAIAREVIAYIKEERPEKKARELGAYLHKRLVDMKSKKIGAIRARGLMIGADIKPEFGKAKKICLEAANRHVLCKDTREQTIRFTPPLVTSIKDLEWAMDQMAQVLS